MEKNRKLNIVFAGTPEFAVPFLKALCLRENVIAAVTQPDRPAGRKRKPSPPPIKTCARANNIRLLQPGDINSAETTVKLKKINPDLIVVVSYGGFLKKPVLDVPPLGCINIHPSLLPRYRGPCPIEWTLISGDAVTGVCCILMDEGMDSGGIIAKMKVKVSLSDTRGTLEKKLVRTGLEVLTESIRKIKEGSADPSPQEGEAVYAPFIKKEDAIIDWNRPAIAVHNLIRAFNPSPGARSLLPGTRKKVIIWDSSLPEKTFPAGKPGEIIETADTGAAVSCGEGNLIIKTVQPEGGKRQGMADFLRGRRVKRFSSAKD